MRRSKLYKQQMEVVGDINVRHTLEEAIELLKKLPGVKFDQTAEVAIKLGIDPPWDGPCSAGQSLSPTVSYCQQFTVMSTGSHLVPLLVITDAQRLTHTTTLIGDAVCDSHT